MGKPGAKKTDQIVSATPGDVHIIMVPSPGGPVPTPIPHPCVSIIKDRVADTVKVMGLPGAVKGSISKHSPPHVPMGPGPFQRPPANKGKIVTASSNVFYEGQKAAMLGDTAEMCADPADAPVGKVIGTAAKVLIGGGGQGNALDRAAEAAAAVAAAAAYAEDLHLHPTTGHPIDVATGTLIVSVEDCALDGPLPIQFVRTYSSGAAAAPRGPLGPGWVHNYDEAIERVAPGHADHADVHAQFVDAGAPSPSLVYLAYRRPLGTLAYFHDIPDGTSRIEPAVGGRVARDGDEYVLLITPYAQHRFAPAAHRADCFALSRIVDRHANELSFTYDGRGRLVTVTDPFRRTLQLSYDAVHRLIGLDVLVPSSSDPIGRVWCRYQYDTAGDLVAVTDRGAGVTTYGYHDHLIVEERSADSYSFFFRYDTRRRCVHTWGEDGYLTRRLAYDDRRGVTWELNGEGESTFYHYDAAGRPTKIERPGGLATTYVRDNAGRLTERRVGPAVEVAAGYDDSGRIAQFENVDGIITSFEYDVIGRCTAARANDGRSVMLAYNERFDVVGQDAPGFGGELKSVFDARGLPISRTGPGGSVHYERDEFGHLTRVSREPGSPLTCAYDAFGRLLWSRLAGRTTTYEWDALDRMVRQSEDGRVVREFRFDFAGHLLWERDGDGFERSFRFSGLNVAEYRPWHRSGEAATPALAFHRYQYDREGRILQVEDEAGVLVRIDYDERGRTRREEFVSEQWTRVREYDAAGRVCGLRDSNGRACGMQLDGAGRVIRAVYTRDSSGSQSVSRASAGRQAHVDAFEFDDAGRLMAATTGNSLVAFESDDLGRLAAVEQDGWSVAYDYDDVGRRTAVRVDGFDDAVTFEYDAPGGRLSALRYGSLVEERQYAPDGQLARRLSMNGTEELFEYDDDWRPVGASIRRNTNEPVYVRQISYDEAGRLAAASDSIRGGRSYQYRDDRLTRVEWERERPAESYTFDSRGNLLDANGRLSALSGGRCPAATPGPDGATIDLEYDAKGQITTVSNARGDRWKYQYDAVGRRTRKTQVNRDGAEIARWEFLWDADNLLAERHFESGRETRRSLFVYDGIAPVVRVDESEESEANAVVFHTDLIGAPDVCTGEDGSVSWYRVGTAFGAGFEAGAIAQNLGYPGQYWDAETGLFYNRYRHYDPAAARYLQPDPIGVNGGWSLHAYTTMPLQSSDPLGLGTRYTIPEREGTQHIMMSDDPKLLKLTSVGGSPNEEAGYHRFSGATQDVVQAAGQGLPRFMGEAGSGQLANTPQLVIETHGRPGTVSYYNPSTGRRERINGRQLARRLKERGFSGDRIILVVCHATEPGAGGTSVAQDLADEMAREPNATRVEVIAANGVVFNKPDGTLVAAQRVRDAQGRRVGLLEHPDDAVFQSFSAGRPPRPAAGPSRTALH
jgi:RHS repeat-associated protein